MTVFYIDTTCSHLTNLFLHFDISCLTAKTLQWYRTGFSTALLWLFIHYKYSDVKQPSCNDAKRVRVLELYPLIYFIVKSTHTLYSCCLISYFAIVCNPLTVQKYSIYLSWWKGVLTFFRVIMAPFFILMVCCLVSWSLTSWFSFLIQEQIATSSAKI